MATQSFDRHCFSCLILFYPCHFSWKVLVWPLRYSPFLLKNGRTQSSSTSIPRNTAWILSLCELSLKGSGNLEISRHSQQVWSVTTKRSTYFTFMFLDIAEPDSILKNTVFIVHSFSAFIKPRKLSNLCWYSKTVLAISFLVSFIRDDREYVILWVCCYDRKFTLTRTLYIPLFTLESHEFFDVFFTAFKPGQISS